ncbi:TKL protein kinase [Phytophthora palmivora]|uniref:TKL protein kinase n=1 Tax=Phytophthora palmivora TaxID=4796 RepID=A0A2P4YFR8_9STRA|nr:TKL protein kinase [Phytophthora palmivora]
MTAMEDALETARLVIISTAAVISSVVAVVLFRRIPDPGYSSRGRGRGRSRSRKPPLPPPHATGPALFYSVIMTDWLFSVTGAVSQSMDMVMGAGVKVRTVIGASVDSLYHVSFLVSLLWGVVLAVFVLRTHRWARGHQATSPPMKRFPVRTSWLTIWTIGLGSGLLSTAKLQAVITDDSSAVMLSNCQRYLYTVVFALSAGSVIAANVVLFVQRRRLKSVEDLNPVTTMTASLGNSADNAELASTKTWELQAQHALRKAHEKLMYYFFVVQILQLPMIVCYVLGNNVVSYAAYEIADCLLFSVPLFNAIVFGWRHLGEARFPGVGDELRNQTMLQSSSNSSRHGERDRMGTGLLAGSGNNGGGNVLASSFRTMFGSSAASSNNGKESMKSTYVGNEMVTLEELNGLTNVGFIAEGAAGSVYKAQWLGIEVAMKVIKLPNGGTTGVVDAELYRTIIQNSEEAFIEEAKLCSRLRHPNITLFMRAGYYEGKLGILTEYCSRGSLKDVLKRHFPLSWRRKVALALHISKGLTYLHARNPTYIHRDLKASNILVTETWQAKLADFDFGISKVSNFVNRVRYSERTVSLAEQNPSVSDELTSFAGTWRWNAPEILQDPHNCRYSRATDMYSFGMVLWEIASDGAIPFSDTKFDFEVREKVLVEQRPPINPGQRCPQRFAKLIEECWAQNPSHRPSAPQAAEILNTILDNMSKDSNDFATMASVSGSEYTNSIFSSLRNGDGTSDLDHRPSSFLGQRITNFFRGRFSARSSSSSAMSEEYHDHQDNDHFYKFTSPYAGPESISMLSARGSAAVEYSPANYETSGLPIVGLPNDSRRGDGLVGGRLSSLDEYDFEMEGNPSDVSTTYSRSPSEGSSSMLPPFRHAQNTNGRREDVRPSEDPRPSEDEAEFVLGANGRIRHLQY